MERKGKGYIWGVVLILLGAFMLASELVPAIRQIIDWPWIIMVLGAIFLLFALFTKTGGLAVPGSIIGGIGAILFYQNLSGDWGSWAYMWALIPGFVGIGIGLGRLISPEEFKDGGAASLFLIALSMVMFIVFGGNRLLGWQLQYLWPAIIIVIGLYLLVRGLLKKSV